MTSLFASLPFIAASPYLYSLYQKKYSNTGKQGQLNHLDPSSLQKNYIQLNLYGAPSRWIFDDLLTPYELGNFKRHQGVGNTFKDDLGNLAYQTQKHKRSGLNLPPLWFTNLSINGHNKQLQNYIDHFLFIRGVSPNVSGHPFAGIKTVRPTLDSTSIIEELSNHDSRLLPPIMIGNNPITRSFNASRFKGLLTNTSGDGLFKNILGPFHLKKISKSLLTKDDSLKLLSDSMSLLESEFGKDNLYYQNLKLSRELFYDDFDSLYKEFEQILMKYHLNMNKTLANLDIPGVTNISLLAPKASEIQSSPSPEEKYGRFMFDMGHFLTDEGKNIFKESHINLWSEQFAITEFLITKGLSSTIQLSPPQEMGHTLYDCKNLGVHTKSSITANQKLVNIPMDAHYTGSVTNTIATTKFFSGIGSGLITFIDALKSIPMTNNKTLFDHSLIHITSEFNRVPNEYLSGSDHLDSSANSTFITGMNHQAQCIGNIATATQEYPQTVGEATNCDQLGRPLIPKDIIHTAYKLIDIPSPLKRAELLFDFQNGHIAAKIEKARNV